MSASGLLSAADVMMATGRMQLATFGESHGLILFDERQPDPWALSEPWQTPDLSTPPFVQASLPQPYDLWLLNDALTSTQSWIANSSWMFDDMWSPKVHWVLERPEHSYSYETFVSLGVVESLIALVFGFLIYFFPFFVALARNHRNKGAIFVLNFLLGFTFIGWAVALVWSFTTQRQASPDPYTERDRHAPPV